MIRVGGSLVRGSGQGNCLVRPFATQVYKGLICWFVASLDATMRCGQTKFASKDVLSEQMIVGSFKASFSFVAH